MGDKLLRRLLMDKTLRLGTAWLAGVLQCAGTDKISLLTHAQLVAILEERATTPDVDA
jgi:hypothetical protein